MARVSVEEVQAWLEQTKLTIASINTALATQIEEMVISRLATAYTTTTWVDAATTPKLVRYIVSMLYASFFIDRQYSEDERSNAWARRLNGIAETMILGILNGSIDLLDVPAAQVNASPSYYPNDASSALEVTDEDSSLGGPSFSMGRVMF